MLYRKYRPQTFSKLVGQDHVVKTLEGALVSGRVGHAYLFTGPRGTGKTTIARIFAKALNCDNRGKGGEPCDACPPCEAVKNGTSLDLIEIDAASQTGVDNIRELTDSAMVAASGGKYKVFLIDEAHMLSKSAFNALLKTLEEPPAHVVIILATTEPHKVISTVLSRVQRFDFKRLTDQDIITKLTEVAKLEGISIEADALLAIARSADGALRDAEVALTKLRAMMPTGTITADQVNHALGLIPHTYHPEFLSLLLGGDKAAAVAMINKIHDSGLDLEHFAKEFLGYVRKGLISRINPATLAMAQGEQHPDLLAADQQLLIKIISVFTVARAQIRTSPIPQLPLELAILEL